MWSNSFLDILPLSTKNNIIFKTFEDVCVYTPIFCMKWALNQRKKVSLHKLSEIVISTSKLTAVTYQ